MHSEITLSEQDLKYAAEYREAVHREALARVRAVCPRAGHVVDRYPAEAYFQEVWDYPGKWYPMVGTPPGAGSRKKLIETIVRETLEYYRNAHTDADSDAGTDTGTDADADADSDADADAGFRRLLAEYPDIVCEYCLVNAENRYAVENHTFPYRGTESHRLALECAARELFAEGAEWAYDLSAARCRRLSGKALFAPANSDKWLNYRRAFLCPPHGNAYTNRDFERFNAVLFPAGAEVLEVRRWTTDWSEYFDEGKEWWGALCLTVYDKTLNRFTAILASATD